MKVVDSRFAPTFELEATELMLGGGPIAGIDEAGRGPWAGPVVAAAVILDPERIPVGIAASKALDADDREVVYTRIFATALAVGVGIADTGRIDRDNILNATMWAMAQAVAGLKLRPRLALVDGNRCPRLALPARPIVKGDAKCLSIAAASIIAKVTRDRMMDEYHKEYPEYCFDSNKGYGTRAHYEGILKVGLCPIHRRSFLKNIVNDDESSI